MEEPLLLALPPTHLLASRRKVRVADLEPDYTRLPKTVIADISLLLRLVELELPREAPAHLAQVDGEPSRMANA